MLNLTNSDKIKTYKHYKIDKIRPGHFISISLKKSYSCKGISWSESIKILRIDPSWSGRIIWKLEHYGFLNRKTDEYVEVLFSVEQIYRNYTLHPILVWSEYTYKNTYTKEVEAFLKKVKN